MFAFRSAARYSAQTTLVVLVQALAGFALTGRVSRDWRPDIPRVWNEEALADWAMPLAGLNARPTHMTAAEYYALPEENLLHDGSVGSLEEMFDPNALGGKP